MYYPNNFDRARAIELGELVSAAYEQFKAFKTKQNWSIPSGYQMVCPILYRSVIAFDTPGEGVDPFELELENAAPVSFGLADSLTDAFGQDIPIGFVATKDKNAYLIFRGTAAVVEWLFDINISMTPYRLKNWGKVSDGFLKIFNRCRESYIKKLGSLPGDYTLYIAGHSLGGAISVLSLPDVIESTHFKKPTLYNFGGPRVGDKDFVNNYNALAGETTFRMVNTCDLVTSIPLPVPVPMIPSGYYSHVGIQVDFTVQLDDVGKNHATDTYLEILKQFSL